MNSHNTSQLIASSLLWVIWLTIFLGIGVLLTFAYTPAPDSNRWIFDFTWVVALVVLLVIPLSLRFLIIPRLKNPWLVFLVFIVGMFFADTMTVVGMFALLEGQQSYILIGVMTLLLFCPYWVSKASVDEEVVSAWPA